MRIHCLFKHQWSFLRTVDTYGYFGDPIHAYQCDRCGKMKWRYHG